MKYLLSINALHSFSIFINIIYYLAVIGIIAFVVRLIKKQKAQLPLRLDLKWLIICACIAFITLVFKAII
jgi:hypothetical protein